MTKNPCRNCKHALEWKGRHYYSLKIECRECEKRKAHERYLESQRKYRPDDYITNIGELSKQTFVYFHDRIRHIEIIKSNQWRVVEGWLKNGLLRYAVRKDEDDTVERTNT